MISCRRRAGERRGSLARSRGVFWYDNCSRKFWLGMDWSEATETRRGTLERSETGGDNWHFRAELQ